MAAHRPEITGCKSPAGSTKKSLAERLVYTVPEAGGLLGLGRNASYDAAKRGDIPTIRMGRLLLVPKGPFHRLVGAEIPALAADPSLGSTKEHLDDEQLSEEQSPSPERGRARESTPADPISRARAVSQPADAGFAKDPASSVSKPPRRQRGSRQGDRRAAST
jgi:hypothetical protein